MKHKFKIAAAVGMMAALPAMADTKLTYGSWSPSTDPFSLAQETFSAEVAEASGGALTFENFYDSTVVQGRTALSGVNNGLVDAAYVVGVYTRTEFPVDSMFTMYSSIEADPFAMTGAMNEMIRECEDCATENTAAGIHTLAYGASPDFYLMCRDPIESFSELEGQSVRAASANLRLANWIGATPVNTPSVEVLEVMRRGQVICVIGSVFWLRTYSLWDEVSWVLDLPVGRYNNGQIFAISQEVWDGLSEEERGHINAALPTLMAEAAANGVEQQTTVREESIKRGVVWAEPTPEMVDTMNEWFASERPIIREEGEKLGVSNADAIVTQFEEAVARWNKLVAETGQDKDAMRAAYKAAFFGDS